MDLFGNFISLCENLMVSFLPLNLSFRITVFMFNWLQICISMGYHAMLECRSALHSNQIRQCSLLITFFCIIYWYWNTRYLLAIFKYLITISKYPNYQYYTTEYKDEFLSHTVNLCLCKVIILESWSCLLLPLYTLAVSRIFFNDITLKDEYWVEVSDIAKAFYNHKKALQ